MKSLGIFIATPGRQSLWRTLHSIAYQNAPVEDVLVVGDGFHKPTHDIIELAASALKLPVRYIATTVTRDFGHTQQNYALKHMDGDYLIYQDDDDIFLPRALTECASLVSAMSEPKPLIGRIKSPNFGLLWQKPGITAVLDGHCIVVPNNKKKLGYFTTDYNGDQAYIHTSLREYSDVAWTDRIWTLTRPEWKLWPTKVSLGPYHWCCVLRRGDIGGPVACTITMEADPEKDIFHVMVDGVEQCDMMELGEVAQFIAYAGQSKDIWIKIRPEQQEFYRALRYQNYEEHATTKDFIELTHSWSPCFWPKVADFNRLVNDVGEEIPDWRDPVWGVGRPHEQLPDTM